MTLRSQLALQFARRAERFAGAKRNDEAIFGCKTQMIRANNVSFFRRLWLPKAGVELQPRMRINRCERAVNRIRRTMAPASR